MQELKELAVKSCYSVIFLVAALVLMRPLMVDQLLSHANAYSTAGMYDESKRQCDKVLFIDDRSSRAWYRLARLYLAQGNRDMAYDAYHKAAEADCTNIPAHYELGVMYVEDDQHQMAIPYLEQVRRLGPERPAGHRPGGPSFHQAALNMLAACYQKVGDTAKMKIALEEKRVYYFADTEARKASTPPEKPRSP